jgi:protein gp37
MSKTKIEWTEQTWNPIVGCSKVSAGCQNCYAERMAFRLAHMGQHQYNMTTYIGGGGWNGNTELVESALQIPLKRKKPTMYFVCSMGDLFHESVSFEWLAKVFAVMALCPQHTFQVLTKRPERMAEYLSEDRWNRWYIKAGGLATLDYIGFHWPVAKKILPNVWLGTTLEHPDYKHRLDDLRKCPATLRFISGEPLLADPGELDLAGIGWVICGGESGPGARPMHPDWARALRDQCKAAGVPFFFKQWGEWGPESNGGIVTNAIFKHGPRHDLLWRFGKKKAGCLLDGAEHKEMPGSTR